MPEKRKYEKLVLREDLTDWYEQVLQEESFVSSDDGIVDAIENGAKTSDVAKSAVVSVLTGEAPPDLLRPFKLLVLSGAQIDVIRKTRGRNTKFKANSGKEYSVPQYVGNIPRKEETSDPDNPNPTDTDDDEPSYVLVNDPRSVEWVENYLTQRIPSEIWTRLLILKYHGGDIRNAADVLIEQINAMVDKLD